MWVSFFKILLAFSIYFIFSFILRRKLKHESPISENIAKSQKSVELQGKFLNFQWVRSSRKLISYILSF